MTYSMFGDLLRKKVLSSELAAELNDPSVVISWDYYTYSNFATLSGEVAYGFTYGNTYWHRGEFFTTDVYEEDLTNG